VPVKLHVLAVRVSPPCAACAASPCSHAMQSMRRHKLLAAQPANCRGDDSDNPYW
jgi:hypothetical protein